jgi:hypothetical protein
LKIVRQDKKLEMVNAKNVTQEHSGRQERKQLIVLLAHLAITSRDQVLLDVEGAPQILTVMGSKFSVCVAQKI